MFDTPSIFTQCKTLSVSLGIPFKTQHVPDSQRGRRMFVLTLNGDECAFTPGECLEELESR